jgi:hypothetical protein
MIENQNQYGKTTAEDIRIFLELFPKFEAEFEEAMVEVSENATLIFNDSAFSLCWSHLYELPFKDQLSHSLGGLLQDETFLQIFKSLASSGNQLAFIPEMLTQVTTYIDSWDELTQEEARELLPIVSAYLAMNRSTFLSLQCVLYHGCFLNELLELARAGNDKALFDSIRLRSDNFVEYVKTKCCKNYDQHKPHYQHHQNQQNGLNDTPYQIQYKKRMVDNPTKRSSDVAIFFASGN